VFPLFQDSGCAQITAGKKKINKKKETIKQGVVWRGGLKCGHIFGCVLNLLHFA